MTRLASTSRIATVSSSATASDRMPGTSRVPLRTCRSWPPPWTSGHELGVAAGQQGADPEGPPTLWPETVIRSAPDSSNRTGRWATACTASVWNGTPCSRATAASSATGCTVPTSLLAHMTLTRATSSELDERRAQAVDREVSAPVGLEPGRPSRPRAATRYSTGSSTAWCSMPLTTSRVRAGRRRRAA